MQHRTHITLKYRVRFATAVSLYVTHCCHLLLSTFCGGQGVVGGAPCLACLSASPTPEYRFIASVMETHFLPLHVTGCDVRDHVTSSLWGVMCAGTESFSVGSGGTLQWKHLRIAIVLCWVQKYRFYIATQHSMKGDVLITLSLTWSCWFPKPAGTCADRNPPGGLVESAGRSACARSQGRLDAPQSHSNKKEKRKKRKKKKINFSHSVSSLWKKKNKKHFETLKKIKIKVSRAQLVQGRAATSWGGVGGLGSRGSAWFAAFRSFCFQKRFWHLDSARCGALIASETKCFSAPRADGQALREEET